MILDGSLVFCRKEKIRFIGRREGDLFGFGVKVKYRRVEVDKSRNDNLKSKVFV